MVSCRQRGGRGEMREKVAGVGVRGSGRISVCRAGTGERWSSSQTL